jgi:hypothetical protein
LILSERYKKVAAKLHKSKILSSELKDELDAKWWPGEKHEAAYETWEAAVAAVEEAEEGKKSCVLQ